MSTYITHIPGPWRWDAGDIGQEFSHRYCTVTDETTEITIAEINEGIPEGHANARLIAAAPEMYDLIRKFKEGTEYTGPISQGLLDAAVEARALLATIDGADDER